MAALEQYKYREVELHQRSYGPQSKKYLLSFHLKEIFSISTFELELSKAKTYYERKMETESERENTQAWHGLFFINLIYNCSAQSTKMANFEVLTEHPYTFSCMWSSQKCCCLDWCSVRCKLFYLIPRSHWSTKIFLAIFCKAPSFSKVICFLGMPLFVVLMILHHLRRKMSP